MSTKRRKKKGERCERKWRREQVLRFCFCSGFFFYSEGIDGSARFFSVESLRSFSLFFASSPFPSTYRFLRFPGGFPPLLPFLCVPSSFVFFFAVACASEKEDALCPGSERTHCVGVGLLCRSGTFVSKERREMGIVFFFFGPFFFWRLVTRQCVSLSSSSRWLRFFAAPKRKRKDSLGGKGQSYRATFFWDVVCLCLVRQVICFEGARRPPVWTREAKKRSKQQKND